MVGIHSFPRYLPNFRVPVQVDNPIDRFGFTNSQYCLPKLWSPETVKSFVVDRNLYCRQTDVRKSLTRGRNRQ